MLLQLWLNIKIGTLKQAFEFFRAVASLDQSLLAISPSNHMEMGDAVEFSGAYLGLIGGVPTGKYGD
jgi:hypothetical protein